MNLRAQSWTQHTTYWQHMQLQTCYKRVKTLQGVSTSQVPELAQLVPAQGQFQWEGGGHLLSVCLDCQMVEKWVGELGTRWSGRGWERWDKRELDQWISAPLHGYVPYLGEEDESPIFLIRWWWLPRACWILWQACATGLDRIGLQLRIGLLMWKCCMRQTQSLVPGDLKLCIWNRHISYSP